MTRDQQEWLEAHQAQLWFAAGKKVGIEVSRPRDGCRLQFSGWTMEDVIGQAKAQLLK
jgi:hypothetical protein